MRFQFCMLLVYLTSQAIASKNSSPFERMWLWNAYQLELAANLPGSLRIAPGCVGTAAGGKCYFKEFIDYIGNENRPYPEILDDPHNLNPDVRDTATRLTASGWTVPIRPGMVMPEVGDGNGGGRWGDMIERVSIIVGNIRTVKFGDANFWTASNTKALVDCQDALVQSISMRQVDLSDYLLPRLRGALPSLNIKVNTVDGTTKTFFDLERTYADTSNAPLRGPLLQFWTTYMDQYADAAGHLATVNNLDRAAAMQFCR